MGDIVDHSLLLTGAVGALICEYIVAIVAVDTFNLAAQKVFIAFMCIYIALFAATWGPITRIRESFHSTTIKGGWGVTENGAIEEDLRPGRAQGKEHSWASRASQSAPGAKSTRITLWRTRLSPGSPCLLGLWSIPEDTCKLQWGIGPRRLPHLHLLLHSDTNGLFLEAIDVLYQNTTPRNSVAYRRRLIAEEDTHGPTDILAGHHENA
ncbi:hypothetical protein FRB94_000944 [Tulasnella sp. JGI-2019a]|nr:hypothetical protein FRB94_000944 [Tulasnella sp. JGI-2019a]KAG9030029.1 hypothetical protein FRB95_004616 [Tulasnella sp. JGI-2019a]